MLLFASAVQAAGKFTLVIGGKISAEDAIEDKTGRMVSAKAMVDLAKAAGGMSLSFDPDAGVVSLTHDGGAVAEKLAGFKGSAVSFVIDGKITRVPAKMGPEGVPFLAPKDLKKLAETLGFAADLDAAGGVLALTPKAPATSSGTKTASAAEPEATKAQSWGLNGTFMKSVQGGATTARPKTGGGGGDVCRYLDEQKAIWEATEPTPEEKEIFNNLAKLWTENEKKVKKGQKVTGNKADLALFEKTLKEFDERVQKRTEGTKNSSPPPDAEEWYSTSVEFLDKVEQTIQLAFTLINEMKLPPDKQPKKEVFLKQHARIQQLNTQVQSIGAQEVGIVTDVRESNGCGPP